MLTRLFCNHLWNGLFFFFLKPSGACRCRGVTIGHADAKMQRICIRSRMVKNALPLFPSVRFLLRHAAFSMLASRALHEAAVSFFSSVCFRLKTCVESFPQKHLEQETLFLSSRRSVSGKKHALKASRKSIYGKKQCFFFLVELFQAKNMRRKLPAKAFGARNSVSSFLSVCFRQKTCVESFPQKHLWQETLFLPSRRSVSGKKHASKASRKSI